MSDFNNNSLSAGRGKALINAITFIKTIERSSPAKVNFLALQLFKTFASSLTEDDKHAYRHYVDPVILIKIVCLRFCMHLNAYLFILSKVALIYFVTKNGKKYDE